MLKVLATGGFHDLGGDDIPIVKEFASCLGEEVVSRGYRLLNENKTQFDEAICSGAARSAEATQTSLDDLIHSYKLRDDDAIHSIGRVFESVRSDWELYRPVLDIPELITEAHAVVIICGGRRALNRANWTRIAHKPLLPVARFGGLAKDLYEQELKDFDKNYSSYVDRDQYQELNQHNVDIKQFAKNIVSLVEQLCLPKRALVVMSFSERDDLIDLYETFQNSCEATGFHCEKVNEDNAVVRIVPAIWEKIRSGAFVFVDLTIPSTNVYYELGYAEALGKKLVVTAKDGTALPFDIRDLPVIYWKNQRDLKKKLISKIRSIVTAQQAEIE